MKKIYINESFISNVVKGRLLPQFLFKLVKFHKTSLGDNEAFPTSDEYPFDYILLKERYNEVCDAVDDIGLESLDEDYLMSELSSLVKRCKEIEEPIRDALERICDNAINRIFAIPQDMVNMEFKLVDKIKFKGAVRMRPESNEDAKYTFKDIADIDLSNKAVEKRRFIDALIQGAAYTYSSIEGAYIDDIDRLSQDLPRLYRKIRAINDYLLFVKKEEMSDDKPMQGSYVETHLGMDGERTTIKVQGMIFPLLLQEAIKGLFELFSSHGLPSDKGKAQYIIRKADFILAEPWDLRLGVGLWRALFGSIDDTNMIPYMFTSLVSIPADEFNITIKEILSNTEKGNEIINKLAKDAEYDSGYQKFTNRINAKNLDKSLIKDSYFSGAETNGYEIDSDSDNSDNGDVIEEDGIEELSHNTYQDASEEAFEREMDNRVRKFRKAAEQTYNNSSNHYHYTQRDDYEDDEPWMDSNKNKKLVIFDNQYKSLSDLYDGVKQGKLLIHARKMTGEISNDLRYIYPCFDETLKQFYGSEYDSIAQSKSEWYGEEIEPEYPELVFASDNFSWCKDTRNGVFFIESDGFQKSLGDGKIQLPNGRICNYWEGDVYDYDNEVYRDEPICCEYGDWYSSNYATVVAVMNLNNNIVKEDTNLGLYESEVLDSNSDINAILANATVDNIDFIEGEESTYGERVYLSVDGVEIPSELVDLEFRPIYKRFPTGRHQLLNIDIILNPRLRGYGLGTKIYAKAVREFGAICSRFSTRHNDDGIRNIFIKLKSFGDIYAAEDSYENFEGSIINDYYAILKSELHKYIPMDESKVIGNELITEGWAKDKRKIIDRTVEIIRRNIPSINQSKAYEIENGIANRFFHANMSGNGKIRKYEPMAANILTNELGYPDNPLIEKETKFLEDALKYMWNFEIRKGIRPSAVCDYDKGVRMDDFRTLVEKYEPKLEELERNNIRVDGREFGDTDYEIIPIPDYKTAHEWGKYSNPKLKLCYTTNIGIWEGRFTNNGKNKCFLCLNKNTWDKWGEGERPENNEYTPYDEYGLSMIWVFIDPKGKIAFSNTRWNHNEEKKIPGGGYGGKNVDESFDVSGLENVINIPFDEAFDVEIEADISDIAQDKLNKIANGQSTFDEEFKYGDYKIFSNNQSTNVWISVNGKINFVKVDKATKSLSLVYPDKWFDAITYISKDNKAIDRAYCIAMVDNKYNLIGWDCELVLPNTFWCESMFDYNGVILLCKNDLKNIFTSDGIMFDEWKETFMFYKDSLIAVGTDGDLSIYKNGKVMQLNDLMMHKDNLPSEVEIMSCDNGINAEYIVQFADSFYNFMDSEGNLLLDYWINSFRDTKSDSVVKVEFCSRYNMMRKEDLSLVYNKKPSEWFYRIIEDEGNGYFICRDDNYKKNILHESGRMAIENPNHSSWFDDVVSDKGNNLFFIKKDEKCNYINYNFELLWNRPFDEWFEMAYMFENGFARVKLSDSYKYNLIRLDGTLVFDEGFDTISNVNQYGVAIFSEEGENGTYKYGLVDTEGTILLDMMFDKVINGEFGVLEVFKEQRVNLFSSKDKKLIYDAPIDEWFTNVYSTPYFCAEVESDKGKNLLSYDGNLLFPDWNLDSIDYGIDVDVAIVKRNDNMYNIVVLSSWDFASDTWFYYVREAENSRYYMCYTNKNGSNFVIYDSSRYEFVDDEFKGSNHNFYENPMANDLGSYLREHFDDVDEIIKGKLYIVASDSSISGTRVNLVGMLGGQPKFLLSSWVTRISQLRNKSIMCRSGKFYNIFNIDTMQYVFDDAIEFIDYNNYTKLYTVTNVDYLCNLVDTDCNVLLKKWAKNIKLYDNDNDDMLNMFKIKYADGKCNLFNSDTRGFVSKRNYDDIEIISGVVRVEDDKKYNLLNSNGEPMSSKWSILTFPFSEGSPYFATLFGSDGNVAKYNILDTRSGEYISDAYILTNGQVEKNGKYNFISFDRNKGLYYMLPQWADNVTNLEDGSVDANVGDKTYHLKWNGTKLELDNNGGTE